METSQPKAIIYDLDGLLIDSEPMWKIAETKVLARYGTAPRPEVVQTHIGLRIDEASQVMIDSYRIKTTAKVLSEEILGEMYVMLRQSIVKMAGAEEIIPKSHALGYALAVASSSPKDYIELALQSSGWQNYISVIASAYETPKGKPAPDVYILAAQRLGTTPAQCIALEDSVNGARAAQSAGMLTIAIPGEGFTADDFDGIADEVYDSLLTVPYFQMT